MFLNAFQTFATAMVFAMVIAFFLMIIFGMIRMVEIWKWLLDRKYLPRWTSKAVWFCAKRTSIWDHKRREVFAKVSGMVPTSGGKKYQRAVADIKTALLAYEDDLNDVAHQGRDKLDPSGDDYSRVYAAVMTICEEALK